MATAISSELREQKKRSLTIVGDRFFVFGLDLLQKLLLQEMGKAER
jgi:hypothetical protein